MGNLTQIGCFPLEGSICPTGLHNAFPYKLRLYVPYFPKTNIPLFHIGPEWTPFPQYPLGMKAFPNTHFTSLNKQIYRAIIDSNFSVLEKILDSDKYDIDKGIVLPEYGLTAMGMACAINNIEVVHYLTKRGVDYEHKIGIEEKTALHISIEYGHDLLAKYLMNNGANIKATDKYGFDSYDKAELRGLYEFKDILDYFAKNPKKKGTEPYRNYKCSQEYILEDIDTLNFLPSSINEVGLDNKLTPVSENEKINLDKFSFYLHNIYSIPNVEKCSSLNTRKKYDTLYNFNNII